MNIQFEGRHVVVTGGTGALGAAVVAELLESGASVRPLPDGQARRLGNSGVPSFTW
jgi:NAD(P)-dependent dehydrogenase (short-subunit alcohol dehydrogenase family)